MGVFPQHEHAILHGAVFRLVARHQLVFALDQVEGCPGALGEGGDEEEEEPQRLVGDEPHVLLGFDDLHQGEGPGQHEHPDDGQPQGQFIAHHLGRQAQAAQEGVLVVGGPAAEHGAVHRQGPHGEHIEEPDVDVGDDALVQGRDVQVDGVPVEGELRRQDVLGEGDHRKGQKGHHRGDDGGQDKEDLVRPRGRKIFFEEQLDGVGQGLKQPPGTYPVGAVAQLDETQDLALHKHGVSDGRQEGHEHQGDLQDRENNQERQVHRFMPSEWLREPGWS